MRSVINNESSTQNLIWDYRNILANLLSLYYINFIGFNEQTLYRYKFFTQFGICKKT